MRRKKKEQSRLHLRAYPINLIPVQLMIMYPRMTPTIPKIPVDAPPLAAVAN